ncbi:MAG: CDP-glycerol glycerophosphotransferase family protein [Eubacteriaceae bacterium]|jgi:CDP-glycerol glycerophosphotransferase (TagB/SpsB family)/cellulose synthase/poly-beta-1,6-N-acetylglucosamine synthase-like glycosyltransferase|nr:CDP-glycerol glycerophosphotransferase family protein [Eubacteriaceae bacterium]
MGPRISVIIPAYNEEKHIAKMLESVKAQVFEDFEAIVINDGSTDGTQKVIDRFCAEDDRFRCIEQDNRGTGAARNAGIEEAAGEYVVFFDAGDYAYPNALESMYAAVRNVMADIAIAHIEDAFDSDVYGSQASFELSQKKEIDRYDKNILLTPEPNNKIFRRRVIIQNGISFDNTENAEDADFLLDFLDAADRITGCDDLVYRRNHRSKAGQASATSLISRGNLERIKEMNVNLAARLDARIQTEEDRLAESAGRDSMEFREEQMKHEIYRSALFKRFTEIILDNYYRSVWMIDDDVVAETAEMFGAYKQQMFPADWKDLCAENRDLRITKDTLMTRAELAEDPLLTVVISDMLPAKDAAAVVDAYYRQKLPAFEMRAAEKFRGLLEERYGALPNFGFIDSSAGIKKFKTSALKNAAGRYIIFVDEGIVPSRRIIKHMFDRLEKTDDVYITARIDGIRAHETVFINEFRVVKNRTHYNKLDWMWGNKMFRVKTLRTKKVLFSDDPVRDMDRLYNNSKYQKSTHCGFVSTLTQSDVLANVKSITVKAGYPCKLWSEARRLALIEKWNTPVITAGQKIKRKRLKYMRQGYKFLSLKVAFPYEYKKYSRKPLEDKVIFVEPRLKSISNSMQPLHQAFEERGDIVIKDHYLAHEFGRYREQYKRTMAFMRDLATAKYLIMAEANSTLGGFEVREGTKVVQVWHGCGAFKKFGFGTADLLFGGDRKEQEKYPMYANYDLVTVSSPEVVWAYEDAMGISHESGIVQPLGSSRTDTFYDEEYKRQAREKFDALIPERNGRKVILYAPTFRGRVTRAQAPDQLDIAEFAEKFRDEYILVIKHHPIVRELPDIPASCQDFAFDLTRGSMDINELLTVADICISDYSSLVFEYSLMERPMIFFAYDLEDYNDWRGFYYDYDQLTPGPVFRTNDEMIDYIEHIDERFDIKVVQDFRQKFMSACDGHATERVLDFLFDENGGNND